MNQAIAAEAERLILERLDALRKASFTEALSLEECEENVLICDTPAKLVTWRRRLSTSECLLGVTVHVRGLAGIFQTRWERGIVFSPQLQPRDVNDPEIELDGEG